jgi:hypothetical protein
MYNGCPAQESVDHLGLASVHPLSERGIVGRGVLIDMARHRREPRLERGEAFTLEDLLAAAEAQGTTIGHGDVLRVRTGWLQTFFEDREAFYLEPFL